MPAATSPLGKPTASKPTGFTKPAGLSRQTAAAKEEEEEESPGLQPIHLGISIVALILAALFAFTTYQADQTPNRVSPYLLGEPKAGDVGTASSSYDATDDEDEDDNSSSSTSGDEDEDDDEDSDE